MKLLFYRWGSASETFLYDALVKQGHLIIVVKKPCTNYINDMELAWELIRTIQEEQLEGIISYNYFPIISSVCETTHIIYYSWIYDCPHYTLFAHQAKLSCNRIYTFDKGMCDQIRSYGVNNIWHLPLAAHADAFTKVITASSDDVKKKYQCDISFVGSMYTGKYNYYDDNQRVKTQLPEEEKGILDEYINSGIFTYGEEYMRKLHSFVNEYGDKTDEWAKNYQVAFGKDFYVKLGEAFLSSVLENKITVEERRRLFTKLACSGHAFHLYTNSDLTGLDEVLIRANHGIVDYETEMPLVFCGSKININCTLKSIHSGIPLRVLDIMACGGFVLSNFQPEIEEYFEIGKDIEIYNSMEECLDKAEYYLKEEEARNRIAKSGREKVKSLFGFSDLLQQILK